MANKTWQREGKKLELKNNSDNRERNSQLLKGGKNNLKNLNEQKML